MLRRSHIRHDRWELGFRRLICFALREGHARVTYRHRERGFPLGSWVRHQRNRFRCGRLEPDKVRRLGSVPGWLWRVRASTLWRRRYDALLSFAEREGRVVVPVGHVEAGLKLGCWVDAQRNLKRERRLSAYRVRLLNRVPGGSWEPEQDSWDRGYAILEGFCSREGHAFVPTQYREGGFELGVWIKWQRRQFKTGRLPGDRARRLGALPGWVWDASEERWERAYALLLEFVEREGHCRIPRGYHPGGFRLAKWATEQRRRRKAGKLGRDRMARLDRVAGWGW
jgi:hypothetical protein